MRLLWLLLWQTLTLPQTAGHGTGLRHGLDRVTYAPTALPFCHVGSTQFCAVADLLFDRGMLIRLLAQHQDLQTIRHTDDDRRARQPLPGRVLFSVYVSDAYRCSGAPLYCSQPYHPEFHHALRGRVIHATAAIALAIAFIALATYPPLFTVTKPDRFEPLSFIFLCRPNATLTDPRSILFSNGSPSRTSTTLTPRSGR